MPKLENAEKRDKKLEKRKDRMKMHGKTSIDLIRTEIIRRAERKAKERAKLAEETFDE